MPEKGPGHNQELSQERWETLRLSIGKVQRAYPQRASGKSTECHKFPDVSGCFQVVFRVFSGSFRELQGVFRVFFRMPFPGMPFGPFH